tara:strand:- start:282 stop:482 length:201 start_codon:yes stop_codon:yes gene_type:complete
MTNLKLNDVEMEEIRKALTVRKEDLECKANDCLSLAFLIIDDDLCTVKKVEKKLATLIRKRKLGLI